MKIRFLEVEEVIILHDNMIQRFGGLGGLRDEGLLHSALAAPQATFGGNYLHQDLFHMSAAYAYGIIKNHPFLDGNKRTGMLIASLFLEYNDVVIDFPQEELVALALDIATSKLSQDDLVELFKKAVINGA